MTKKYPWFSVIAAILLISIVFLLLWHPQNPSQETRNAPLRSYFEKLGFSVAISSMDENRNAPIYKPSVWESWRLDGEELLVYFDESNRADFLSGGIDKSFGYVTRYGLRFVLVYQGTDERILQALENIPKDEMA